MIDSVCIEAKLHMTLSAAGCAKNLEGHLYVSSAAHRFGREF